MKTDPAFQKEYSAVREGGAGLFDLSSRGLIEVSGGEAVMFLNGLITNDVQSLPANTWMPAAFPNVQGRLLAISRVWRKDDKFYFDTEAATRENVLKIVERFVPAGDFNVRDLSDETVCFSLQGKAAGQLFPADGKPPAPDQIAEFTFSDEKITVLEDADLSGGGYYFFVPKAVSEQFRNQMETAGAIPISTETFEVLRIESGLPLYGVDMDETTVVLETGLDKAVSFTKGCYIGQEIIARIHFRGHVAKRLSGLIFDETAEVKPNDELRSSEGKPAGRVTSVTFSPKLQKTVALAYVRYEFLAEGTLLNTGDHTAKVANFPVL